MLPVILFHAGFQTFRGGFVGVDVFFVISGYLITGIILTDLQAGQFSVARFYERRARRILPALFVVVLASWPLAWWLLTPLALQAFAGSVMAVVGFGSNILFWRESGYFAPEVELKPLLHTWSLAVEEQYYLLAPLALALLWRGGRRRTATGVGALGLASFGLATWLAPRDAEAAFYLLPTRAWELALGALVAMLPTGTLTARLPRTARELGAVLGLGLILGATLLLDASAQFPGPWALVPTVGTALVILLAEPTGLAGRLLGAPLLVGVGLISYSAYLWHQVLFAFARHAGIFPSEPGPAVILIGATLALAALTWRYVERPFRDATRVPRRTVAAWAVAGSLALLVTGAAGFHAHGVPGRLDAEQHAFLAETGWVEDRQEAMPAWQHCNFYHFNGTRSQVPRAALEPDCRERNPAMPRAVLVWGDSHAQHLHRGLAPVLPPDWQLLMVSTSGCRIRLVDGPSRTNACRQSNWFARELARTTRPDVVILAQRDRHGPAALQQVAASLREAGVQRVILLGPVPEWSPELPHLVALRLWDHTPQRTWLGVKRARLREDARLRAALAADSTLTYVSATDQFCGPDGCLVYLGTDRTPGITSWDYGHLTAPASRFLAERALVPAVTEGFSSGEDP